MSFSLIGFHIKNLLSILLWNIKKTKDKDTKVVRVTRVNDFGVTVFTKTVKCVRRI